MPIAPSRLGELLEKRGEITREQLMRALRNQKVVGGRLGTCLLEIEALTEEQLCDALAEQLGVPFATPEDLRGLNEELLELLPSKVARRCQAVAFHSSSTQVKVALIDARNLALQDEISFVVGKRIRWYVAPELRMLEALEKHYGEECPTRFAKLLDKMNRSRFLWAREKPTATAIAAPSGGDQLQWDAQIAGMAATDARPFSRKDAPSSVSLELPQFQHQTLDLPVLDPMPDLKPDPVADPVQPSPGESTRAPAPSAAVPPVAPVPPAAKSTAVSPPAAPPKSTGAKHKAERTTARSPVAKSKRVTVEETEQLLLQPRERDDVARALLDFAMGLRPRAVLFVVRKAEVLGWMWSGPGIDEARMSALRLNLEQPSLFAGLKEEGAYYRGPLPRLPAHVALSSCFAAPPIAGDVLVLPVKVKDRLVAALLVEPGLFGGSELAPADLADLQRVIAKAAIGFELCIMRSKLRQA